MQAGGYLSTDNSRVEPLLTFKTFIVQHHQYTIITSVYSLQVTPYSIQVTGYTSVLKTIIIVSIDGNISITSLYYHLITISYHNIIISISINIIINIILFNIIAYITISLCLLTSHVTMTCVNVTNTGWLPPHSAKTK